MNVVARAKTVADYPANALRAFGSNARIMLSCLGNYRIQILMYHSISDDSRDPWSVSKVAFESQMEWLYQRNFKVMSLSEALNNLDNKRLTRNCVVLTFDDGYADFLENAVPVLVTYGFPSTLFVLPGLVGGRSYWERAEIRKPLLDWRGFREVVQSGCSIGSHGMVHADLPKLQSVELVHEVGNSKNMLEDKLGVAVDSFCYPWGRYSGREISVVREAGYLCAVSVGSRWGNGLETERYSLEREAVSCQDSIADFALKVTGHKKVLRKVFHRLSDDNGFCRRG